METSEPLTRQRLLDAASTRFRRLGPRHASVASITAAAGTGKGSLYLHYASKEELYLDTVRQAVETFLDSAEAAMTQVDSAPMRLHALVEMATIHYERDDLLSAPLLDDRDLVGAAAASLARQLQRDRITELIEQTLRDGQSEGTIRGEIDAAASAAVLFEIGWAIVRSHLLGDLPLPLAEALETLNAIVGRGTMAPSPLR